jgi:hypothetical protein
MYLYFQFGILDKYVTHNSNNYRVKSEEKNKTIF